jgi:hypothetical protein
MVPCPQRAQSEAAQENNQPISRRPTVPSRASTFDQRLPPYSIQDPLPQDSRISTIGEDVSGEQSRAVTPS